MYCKTAVKRNVAPALCTRVRTTVVFSKLNFKTELLVRTRVQSIASERQKFDFESSFAVLFESTTKPQREAQKCISEPTFFNITGILQRFSNRAQILYYKTADFWGSEFREPFRSTKTVLWRTTMRQTAEKAVPLAKSTVKPQRKCAVAQKHRETLGGKCRTDPARSRVYYHRQVRTPYRYRDVWGTNLNRGIMTESQLKEFSYC